MRLLGFKLALHVRKHKQLKEFLWEKFMYIHHWLIFLLHRSFYVNHRKKLKLRLCNKDTRSSLKLEKEIMFQHVQAWLRPLVALILRFSTPADMQNEFLSQGHFRSCDFKSYISEWFTKTAPISTKTNKSQKRLRNNFDYYSLG